MLQLLTIVLAIAFSVSNVPPQSGTLGHIETPSAADPPEMDGGSCYPKSCK